MEAIHVNLIILECPVWINGLELGLCTVPSDRYGHTIDGQVTGMVQPSTVHQVCSADPQWVQDGYRDSHSMVDGIGQLSNQSIMMLVA
jgi:hypothetical protein